jgi:RNA polymerase sigma-70 factor, ECF subfamily
MATITPTRPRGHEGEAQLLAALRAGDEASFDALVREYQPLMLRLARAFTPSRAVAEEVVQEAWLGVLRGLDAFEGRSSLRTWILRIVGNRAKTRGEQERRTLPFSSVREDGDGPAVDPDRFLPADHPQWPGHWAVAPSSWAGDPEARLLGREVGELLGEAIDGLPDGQRAVVRLRDVEGWSAEEVCAALGLSAVNQRVLLHRGRSRLRQALEDYLEPSPPERGMASA